MLKLRDWLRRQGCVGLEDLLIDKTLSGDNNDTAGYGCFAKRNFSVGEILFEVPQRCLFSLCTVHDGPFAVSINHYAIENGMGNIVTLEFLIWMEMARQKWIPEEFYHDYLNTFSDEDPTIAGWDDNLQRCALGTNLGAMLVGEDVNRLTKQVALLHSFHNHVTSMDVITASDEKMKNLLPPIEAWALPSIQWARGHYLSRRYPGRFVIASDNRVPDCSGASIPLIENREAGFGNLGALVPLLDILNHKPGKDWISFNPTATALQVICNHPISAGEEMFSNYGDLSNEMLLYAYGFAIDNNEHDSVAVSLGIHSASETLGRTFAGPFYLTDQPDLSGVPEQLWRMLTQIGGSDPDASAVALSHTTDLDQPLPCRKRKRKEDVDSDSSGGVSNAEDTDIKTADEIKVFQEESPSQQSDAPVEVGYEEISLLNDFLIKKYNELLESEAGAKRCLEEILHRESSINQTRARYLNWYRASQSTILNNLIAALSTTLDDIDGGDDAEDDD